ncbi:MAG: GAF domain-containing protein, partial [Chloroflexi bacterium]
AEVSLAETVAAQVAGAVANARLFERQRSITQKIQQRNRELAVINRASQVFNSTLKLDELLQTILNEVNHLLNIVGTSFWLYEPDSDELVCRQATGSARDKIIGWRLRPGEGVTGQAAQTGQSIIVSDTHQDTRHYKGVDQETKLEIRSLACIPLLSKGHVIGVLNMSDVEVGRFTTDDLKLLDPWPQWPPEPLKMPACLTRLNRPTSACLMN